MSLMALRSQALDFSRRPIEMYRFCLECHILVQMPLRLSFASGYGKRLPVSIGLRNLVDACYG